MISFSLNSFYHLKRADLTRKIREITKEIDSEKIKLENKNISLINKTSEYLDLQQFQIRLNKDNLEKIETYDVVQRKIAQSALSEELASIVLGNLHLNLIDEKTIFSIC